MNLSFETVSVIGLGYIGLPTAAIMASRGLRVLGVDVNPRVIDTVGRGDIHIVEPDLHHLVRGVVSEGALTVSRDVSPADAFVIAVPTPIDGQHRPDLTYVQQAVRSIAPVLKKGDLVVIESTCPVGATEAAGRILAELRRDLSFPTLGGTVGDVFVAYCPERVLPGRILTELVSNDRSVGGLTPDCTARAASLYEIFVQGTCVRTDARTAELVKLTENAFRDVNIAFANELSLVCETLDLNVWEVVGLANRHPRVNILQPGPGVGGHCIAVDPWFIVDAAPEQTPLMRTAREVNDHKPHWVAQKVREALEARPSAKVACLGLAYKADVDDLRESPALEIATELAKTYGERVVVVEPYVDVVPRCLEELGARGASLAEALGECEVVALLVDHHEFKGIEAATLASKTVIDTRGLWSSRREATR